MEILEKVCVLLNRAAELESQAAALLNCKVTDNKKVTAALMEREGRLIITVKQAGRTYTIQYKQGTQDSLIIDSEAAKKLLAENGLDIPMKKRKGNSPTITIK